MTIKVEGSSSECLKRIGHVNKGRINKKHKQQSKRILTRSKQVEPKVAPAENLLQRLYYECKDVFKGDTNTALSNAHVQTLRHILDSIKPEDVGLSPELKFFNPTSTAVEGVPRVIYTGIYQCKNFSLCMFFLPENAVIPLHNHPGMTVFSKLLLGTMHVKAYDWANSEDISVPPSNLRLAKLKANGVFTAPCDTSILYPTSGGNIHEFKAIRPSVVLDVIGPPYSIKDGRDCSYYKDAPYSAVSMAGSVMNNEEADSYGWLEEIEMPKESMMNVIPYMGPEIQY